jgi:hypothetical protein
MNDQEKIPSGKDTIRDKSRYDMSKGFFVFCTQRQHRPHRGRLQSLKINSDMSVSRKLSLSPILGTDTYDLDQEVQRKQSVS